MLALSSGPANAELGKAPSAQYLGAGELSTTSARRETLLH